MLESVQCLPSCMEVCTIRQYCTYVRRSRSGRSGISMLSNFFTVVIIGPHPGAIIGYREVEVRNFPPDR